MEIKFVQKLKTTMFIFKILVAGIQNFTSEAVEYMETQPKPGIGDENREMIEVRSKWWERLEM